MWRLSEDILKKLIEHHKPNPYMVITGCARSGTQYIAKALDAIGFKIGHWNVLGEQAISSDLLAPWKCIDDCLVLHQVRDPLKQIGSMQTAHNYTWDYISQVIKFEPDDLLLVKCMKYWYRWNKIAEKRAEFTYQVENLPWAKILTTVGAGYPGCPEPTVSKKSNSRAGMYEPVTWEILEAVDAELCGKIKELAEHYAY